MLKLKDNVDIRELEKYGFKFKHSQHTGEIVVAIKEQHLSHKRLRFFKDNRKKGYNEYREEEERKNFRALRIAFGHMFELTDRFYKNRIRSGFIVDETTNYGAEKVDMDTLYELIKDGLIEKVNFKG